MLDSGSARRCAPLIRNDDAVWLAAVLRPLEGEVPLERNLHHFHPFGDPHLAGEVAQRDHRAGHAVVNRALAAIAHPAAAALEVVVPRALHRIEHGHARRHGDRLVKDGDGDAFARALGFGGFGHGAYCGSMTGSSSASAAYAGSRATGGVA